MKKFICCLLAALLMTGLAACTFTENEQNASSDTTASGQNAGETTGAPDDGGDAVEKKDLKVGMITLHDENSTYDANFINCFNAACLKLGVTGIIKSGIEENNNCYETALDLVDEGCKLVFADSFGHEDFMIRAASETPDVEFCHATGTKAHTEGLPNFHNAFASIYEGRYLAGVAAGLKLNEMLQNKTITEAKMGYIGAYTYAEVISGYTSFYLGAKSVCPSVTMLVTFTGTWYDETLEKEAANTLINKGCVLISQHADSMGAPTACEAAGVPNVSYNGSTYSACPNTFIISSRINWEPYFEYIINAVLKGTSIDTDWVGTLKTGSVELSEINEKAAASGTAEKLAEVKAALEAGTVNVFDTATFTKDGSRIDGYYADVDTDDAFEPDTEVVIDGVFYESKYRSAPYFDITIDGIELLNSVF